MKSSRVIIIIVLLLLFFGGFSGWQYAHRRIYRELQAVERVIINSLCFIHLCGL